jgi:Flp pilus assembly protein TadD
MKLSAKDIVDANSHLSKALIINSNDQIAGHALLELWRKQVAAAPKDANAHMGLARAYQLTGRFDLANTEYATVMKLDPKHPNLAVAVESLKHASARQQAAESLQNARTLASHGAFSDASKAMEAALSVDPNDPELLLFQGELLERTGHAGEAAEAYRAILYADPQNAEAAKRLKMLTSGKINFSMNVESVPGDEVARLSNFLLLVRNQTMSDRQKQKKVERLTQKYIRANSNEDL